MKHPWHDDYPRSEQQVLEILRADHVDLPLRHIERLGSGWDFTTYRVDRDWVFRIPKRDECVAYFHAELDTLGRLNLELDRATVQIPDYQFVVTESQEFPLPYGGYRLLEGRQLLELRPGSVDLPGLCATLGEFLGAVHDCRTDAPSADFQDPFPSYIPHFQLELGRLREALDPGLARSCQVLLDTPYPLAHGQAALHHGDLGPEHLLIDPDSGALTGIIDWGDAGWGDPMLDFVGLWIWAGDSALAAAVRSYPKELNAEEWARIRFRGACVGISQAYYGHASGKRDMLDRAVQWLERIRLAGQLDDVNRSET